MNSIGAGPPLRGPGTQPGDVPGPHPPHVGAAGAGELTLAGGATVASADEQNKAFQAMIDRRPLPLRRLNEERWL